MSDFAALAKRVTTGVVVKTVAVLAVLGLVAGVVWWRTHLSGIHMTARFTAAVGVYPGSDVRILGVPVGKVDKVTPHGTDVWVSMHLNPGVNVRADTWAVVVSPNLVSDRYVQLTGVYATGPKLADDATIGTKRTRTPVELDALYHNLIKLTGALGPQGANKNGAFSRLIDTGARNLRGNTGKNINNTITALGQSSNTLAASENNIFSTIDQLSQFTDTLRNHNSQLSQANVNFAAVSKTLAADRYELTGALHELAQALGEVQTFIQDNRAALTDNVQKLDGVTKVLETRQASLAEALNAAPSLVQNFINAYDSKDNVLRARADLNELTLWAQQHASASGQTASTSAVQRNAPPALLPGSNGGTK